MIHHFINLLYILMRHEANEQSDKIIKSIKIYENFPKPGVNFLDIF